MKLSEVPQDQDPTFEGAKKLCYAVREDGQYVQTLTNGWSAEQTVKDLAWKVLDEDLEGTRQKVLSGELSALTYFMKLRQMDARLLAQNMGRFVWRVKWHLRPRVFKKLKPKWLERYADCLDISVQTLRDFRGQDAP